MKVVSQRRMTGLKKSVIFTLIIAMMITLIPTDAFAASVAYPTEDPNADLYPFPLDMDFLPKYLYGSEENTKGKVYAIYGRTVPNEWIPREMPPSLKSSYWGKAVVHTTVAKAYFYPGRPPINYHKKRIEELSQTAYRYLESGWNRCWTGTYQHLWRTWNGAVCQLEAGRVFYAAQVCLHH